MMIVCNHLDDQAMSKLLMKSTHHKQSWWHIKKIRVAHKKIRVAHKKIRETHKKIRETHKSFRFSSTMQRQHEDNRKTTQVVTWEGLQPLQRVPASSTALSSSPPATESW